MNIDIAIFIGFLAVNLVVGLSVGRKTTTIQEYALGGRNFSTAALVSTIVATAATGSGFFVMLSKAYTDGLSIIIAFCSEAVALIITAFFLIPKMGEFMGSLSIAEVMGKLYGKHVRFITAICGILWIIGTIAVQFKVFGNLFNYFLGISQTSAILIAAVVVIVYSAFGGIRAVTYTDILQFLTFGVIIPLIGIMIWNDAQNKGFVFNTILENPKFDITAIFNFNNPDLLSLLFLIFYFSVPVISPAEFQRISMGRNIKQIKLAFLVAAALFTFINLAVAWIPTLIVAIAPGLDPTQIVSYIINNYTYTGLKGLIIVGVSAMAMSTADSLINSSSVLFGHDLKEVFGLKIDNLILSKLFALVLGVFAVYLALSTDDLLDMVMTSASFYMPVVTIPLIMSVIGFRSSTKSVLIAMIAGFSTVILWRFLDTELDVIIPAMIVNLVFLYGSHYLLSQPGGWIKVINENDHPGTIKKSMKNTFIKFNLIGFCKKTAPKNELMYMGLGIYCIFYTFTTMYSTQVELLRENGRVILAIYQIMMVTGVVMAMYPIWPPRIKHEIIVQIAWNIVIFYMLIFFSCFFVMLSNFGQLQFVVFTLNIVMTATLVGWKLGSGMAIIGFYSSVQFYKFYIGVKDLDVSLGSPQFIFMYSLMLIGSAFIIFLKPKQEYIEATEEKVDTLENEVLHLGHEVTDLNEQVTHFTEQIADKNKEIDRLGATAQKILNNVNHELRLPIGNVINFSEMMQETLQKSENNKLLKELAQEVYDNSNRVSTMILNMLDLATLDVKKVDLQKTTINFSELVVDRVKRCRKIYLRDKKINFELIIEPEIMISIDPNYIRQTVDNLVINAINFSKAGLIKVTVVKEKGQVVFTIMDQGIGIPTDELSDIFDPFKMGKNTESKACGRGVGLTLCKSAVEAHGGSISADSPEEVGAILKFTLPFGDIKK